MSRRTYPTAPAIERGLTLRTLEAAGWTTPPTMGPRWRPGESVSSLEGVAVSLATRREAISGLRDDLRARRVEEAEVFGLDLDAPDRQPVSLAYLEATHTESDLGAWVDRQYGTGRIQPGYYVESVRKPGGRPVVGRPVQVRLPDDVLAAVDEAAAASGVGRAEWVRRAIVAHLDAAAG